MITEIVAVVDITVIEMIEGMGIMIITTQESGVGMIMIETIKVTMGDIIQTIIILAGEEVTAIIMDGNMEIITIGIILNAQGIIIKIFQWQSLFAFVSVCQVVS